MAILTACPDAQTLRQFVLGQLPARDIDSLAAHLLECEPCVRVLDSLSAGDRLTETMAGHSTLAEPQPESQAVEGLVERLKRLWDPLAAADPHATFKTTFDATPPVDSPRDSGELVSSLAPPQQPGELGRLGNYRVLQVLGAGGMGVVFRAEDTQLKRVVALKMIKPGLTTTESIRKRFVREAQAAAAVEHDHIVPIYQVGQERDIPFLAMQFLKGETLDERLKRQQPLPTHDVLRIGRQIAEGLSVAHQRGLIHRDIKPSNIWLEELSADEASKPAYRVKILDFGLARAAIDDEHLTMTGAIAGTPAYMAPEQAHSQPVDYRADLFSLGCVLYRCCTGKLPFPGSDTLSILSSLATVEPIPPEKINPEVSGDLSKLVMQLLAKDRNGRPASAKEVLDRLRALERQTSALPRAVAGSPDTATEPTEGLPVHPLGQPLAASARRHKLPMLAAGLLLLLGGGILAAQIVIKIKGKDGQTHEVKVDVPSGSEADVTVNGKSIAKVPGSGASPAQSPKQAGGKSVDEAWKKHVATLPAEEQVKAVAAKLKELNPRFDGKVETQGLTRLVLLSDHIEDLSPLQALPNLKSLICRPSAGAKGKLADLSPLAGMKLTSLEINGNQVRDLSPLAGMEITSLEFQNNAIADLSPLRGMPLTNLDMTNNPVADLAPLRGMPLVSLSCIGTKISDLSPLRGMALKSLYCQVTEVADLAPLRGMPLVLLTFGVTKVTDLAPLQGMPLQTLYIPALRTADLSVLQGMELRVFSCDEILVEDLSFLRNMPLISIQCGGFPGLVPARDAKVLRAIETLTTINKKPAAEFWKQVGAQQTTADPDRRAAEWVLSLGGSVEIIGKQGSITAAQDLPPAPFKVRSISVSKAPRPELVAHVKDLSSLTRLHLNECLMFGDAVLTDLQARLKSLEHLSVTGTSVTFTGIERNAKHLPNLFYLSTPVGCSDRDLESLKALPKLQSLSLWNSYVTGEAVVRHFPKLRSLYLQNGEFGDRDLESLAALPEFYGLRLDRTKVTNAGLANLNRLKGLTTLSLKSDSITDAGLAHLTELKTLAHLDLTKTGMTDAGLKHLYGLKQLPLLDVRNTKVSAAAVKDLAAALPQCRIESDHGVFEPAAPR